MQILHKNNQSTEANYKYKKNKICEKSHKNIKNLKKGKKNDRKREKICQTMAKK